MRGLDRRDRGLAQIGRELEQPRTGENEGWSDRKLEQSKTGAGEDQRGRRRGLESAEQLGAKAAERRDITAPVGNGQADTHTSKQRSRETDRTGRGTKNAEKPITRAAKGWSEAVREGASN